MTYAQFATRFPEATEIGRAITETQVEVYCDNGRDVGVVRINRGSTCVDGVEILFPEDADAARGFYRKGGV